MLACFLDTTLMPQTQSQEVMDHTLLSGTVCALQSRGIYADTNAYNVLNIISLSLVGVPVRM